MRLIISTYPTKGSASKAAKELVKLRLAACVNISKISSIYEWKGRIEDTPEYLALFKTTTKNRKKLRQKIQDSHPYDVPEIAELDIASINGPYLKWLAESVR